jgi:hypothetical protein
MNITVEIKAPELAKAIETLALALASSQIVAPVKEVSLTLEGKEVAKTKVPAEKPGKKEEPKTKADPAVEEKEAAREEITATKEESPKVTLEVVRATLAKLSQSGKQAQVKKLIKEIGEANKLTEIDPSRYEALLEAAEEIA